MMRESMTQGLQQPSLLQTVARTIDDHRLILPGATVVVGVSGGVDSVAMLRVLHQLSVEPSRRYRLAVAHLDHGLRDQAAADARFVAELARTLGLPYFGRQCDVRAHALATGQGIEQAGRQLRYDFLFETARQLESVCVAVGHHADDNAETVLHRILRGTSLHGLKGIAIRRRLLAGEDVELARPLLACRRSDIELYARQEGLTWREDASNADIHYRRNFIRHELLSAIREKFNARADEALLRLAQHAAEIDAFLASQAQALLAAAAVAAPSDGQTVEASFDANRLALADPAVQAYAIRQILEQAGLPMRAVGQQQICELRGMFSADGPRTLSLGGSFAARREGGRFVVGPAPQGHEEDGPCFEIMLALPGTTRLPDGGNISCRLDTFDPSAFAEHLRVSRRSSRPESVTEDFDRHVEWLDADQVHGPLRLRPRRDGDTFKPLGCPGGKSVSDFLTDLKLPHPLRPKVLCLCDELGIVCLWPLRIDQRTRVTNRTSRVLRICAH
jgi:tRNA(Ile)-lysidine synthase